MFGEGKMAQMGFHVPIISHLSAQGNRLDEKKTAPCVIHGACVRGDRSSTCV